MSLPASVSPVAAARAAATAAYLARAAGVSGTCREGCGGTRFIAHAVACPVAR